jgi:hypothetical protein
MRSAKWLLLAFGLASLAGACASPLDEPIGRGESALRIASEAEIVGLPGCDVVGSAGVDGGAVLSTVYDGLYAVEVSGSLVCVDDNTGLSALGMIDPLQGTPLPARSGATTSNPEGTPLPAKR